MFCATGTQQCYTKASKGDLLPGQGGFAAKGRPGEVCDIILRKIESQKSYRKGDEPTSIYHIEYEPRLIVRGSTGYAPDESNNEKKKK